MKQKNIFTRKFWELTGCVHNHSEYSHDSSVPISKIIKAARVNHLDYFTINDHRNKDAANDIALGKERDIFCIVGVEINDPDNNNHALVFNSDKIITGASAEYYTSEYEAENAVTFIAHPIEKRKSDVFRTYQWTDHTNTKFAGMEIWNFVSDWVGHVNPKLNGIFMAAFPAICVRKPHQELLNYWDDLNKQGLQKSAIGSVDAHEQQHKFMGIKFRFLTHKYLFKTIRTNVLIHEEKELSQATIIEALANGNSYIVNYKCGDPYNFFAGISNKKNSAIFGEEITWQEDMKFYYRLPKICKIKLICDGKVMAKQHDEKGHFIVPKPGSYRLEISFMDRGWIYSNNIYVTK